MAIKINGNDLQKRFVGTTEIVRVYKAGYQVRPDAVTPNYLCFEGTAGETNQVKLVKHGTAISTIYFEYSFNQTSWTDLQYDTWIDISNGAKVYIRNKNTSVTYITASSSDYFYFVTSHYNSHIKASGDVTTLLCKEGTTTLPTSYCFYRLFYNCSITTAPTLPATTLTSHCYDSMFYGTDITVAPSLPATTLATYCYNSMFKGSGLVTAPSLPATTLTSHCYFGMFEGCSSLTTAPTLSATTLAVNCYETMFRECTSLVTAPSLPATTLTTRCYSSMFEECTSLVTAPSISATTMSFESCQFMFAGCSSLTTVPQLLATTLAEYCYYSMFLDCTSLVTLPLLPAPILARYCYEEMFAGCASIKLSETQTGEYQTPYSIDGTIATDALDGMFSDTGGTFTGTPTNFTTYYTSNTII